MADSLPAITGYQLIRLLKLDGWVPVRDSREGVVFHRRYEDGTFRSTVVGRKRRPLTDGVLAAILGPRQTGIGRDGLRTLIQEHGLK